jgi:OOP family OmpA-OmpF porin
MKKNTLVLMLVLLVSFSCNQQNEKKEQSEEPSSDTVSTSPTERQSSQPADSKFEISNIQLAENFEGSFPYFNLPEGYTFTDPNKYHGKGVEKEVDKEYFYNQGIYFPMEGKTFKAVIRIDSDKFRDKVFSKLEVQKSFDEFIASLGGVKINNGVPVQSGEKNKLNSQDPNAYTDGYMHSCHNYDNVHTYVIRTEDKTVFVQYNLGSEQANITVLEPEAFVNKMKLIPAAEIQKELDEKGKAILYINFDTDKATLKPDGKQYVDEIAKLLNNIQELKLSIEGHTDNTGDANHNKKLSEQRAASVMKELISAGITSSRLQVKGFGSEKPLVANDTESNKAKNRRVELLKI